MSADVLREAATKMRQRAEDARAGRWIAAPSDLTPEAALVLAEWEHGPRRVATCAGSLPEGNAANAEHIAAWHPAVALAVADLLDIWAREDLIGSPFTLPEERDTILDLARAYLGREA